MPPPSYPYPHCIKYNFALLQLEMGMNEGGLCCGKKSQKRQLPMAKVFETFKCPFRDIFFFKQFEVLLVLYTCGHYVLPRLPVVASVLFLSIQPQAHIIYSCLPAPLPLTFLSPSTCLPSSLPPLAFLPTKMFQMLLCSLLLPGANFLRSSIKWCQHSLPAIHK